MDVVISGRQDEPTVPEPPSLIKISNDGCGMKTPIFTLPTEITVFIFQQCESDIRPRLKLTHTCRRWRQIAVNSPSLWTNMRIYGKDKKQNSRLDDFISLLGMQLDRTANLLLDVDWIGRAGDEIYVATLHLIREKAPFSRWRSLRVHIVGGSHDEALWSTAGAFTNLESLIVRGGEENTISSSIDRTVTSRLRALEVTWPYITPAEIVRCFAKSLTHISTLRLRSFRYISHEQFLPANVVNLEIYYAWEHPFPHIQMYKLGQCIFTELNLDLRITTTLIVRGTLEINPDVQVSLPALRELTLKSLDMDSSSIFEGPALESLYFTNSGNKNDLVPLTSTKWSLLQQGYLVSPNTSITVDSYLPSTVLINLLARSPKVTRATLRFDDWERAQVVLGRLLRFDVGTYSHSEENETLCPRLSELRLDFGWGLSDASASKE